MQIAHSGGPTQRHFGLAHLRQRADRVPGAALRHPERACLLQCGAGSASSRRECRDVSDLPTGAFLSACVDGDAQSYWRILERGRAGAPHEVGGCTCGTPSAEIQCLGYSLRDWCSGELLDMLERTGIAGTGWMPISPIGRQCTPCASTPASLVITNLYYRHARYIFSIAAAASAAVSGDIA